MSDKEVKELFEKIESFRQKVTKSKEASRTFLVELGVFTEKGKLKQNYKHLCIPQDQD